MPESVTHGTTTLAETEKEKTIDAPSVVGKGICQLTFETTPADAVVAVDTIDGGRYRISRRSHYGQRIAIAYRISYGLGRTPRTEAETA